MQGSLEGGALTITSESLDIVGPGADVLAINAASGARIFKIFGFETAEDEVLISGLSLTGGDPAGGRYGECADDNGHGGAILSTNTQECFPTGNAAALTLSKVTITDNEGVNGGGVAVEQRTFSTGSKAASATGPASLTVSQSTINHNDAEPKWRWDCDVSGIDESRGEQFDDLRQQRE